MPTPNVRQLMDGDLPVYPITDKSLVIGLQDVPFESYVVAWDGASTPVVANIPAGVQVTYNTTTYTGTLAASSSTAPYLYLVASASQQGEYDRYITTLSGSSHVWTALGSTAPVSPVIVDNLTTNDASKALSAKQGKVLGDEVSQLELEVHNLSGKYYGVFPTSGDLPDDATTPGYAFVGASEPFAIYNFDGEEWEDTGATANSIQGEPGVGFDSVTTQEDGSFTIHLTNGDTITIDLTHNHPDYYSKVVGTVQPSGGFLPDVAYNLGTVTGTVTFALASAVSGNLNHYFWMFDTGGTPPTITWPSTGITWAAGSAPTVAANKKYEISILGGVAYYSEV